MKRVFLFFCLIILSFVSRTPAGEESTPPGFRGEYLGRVDVAARKLIDLAEAMPEEKYSWRPGEGIRSIGEVYVHVASANYYLPRFVGVEPPSHATQDMEKTITEKSKVIETLKQSFDHLRQAVLKTSDGDLEKSVEMFGKKTTARDTFLLIAMHMHEHLGQSIAYARMNGVVPPWGQEGN